MPAVVRSALGPALLLFILASTGVDSHAALTRSDPPAGAVLAESPAEIRLWFTEPLEESYTGVDLLDAEGEIVLGVSFSVAPDDDHQLVVRLLALPDGAYTVAWRTLSAADGHTLQGYFGFSVGTGMAGSVAPISSVKSGLETARPLTRGLALLGLAASLAIAPMMLGVLGPAAKMIPELADAMRSPARRYAVVAAVLAVLGSVAVLAAQAAAVFPDERVPVAMAQALADTRYGQLWLLRLALILLCIGSIALALWTRERWARGGLVAAAMLALALPLPFSLLSHAAAQQEGRTAAIAADALHLLTASVWAGGLVMLTLVLLPATRTLGAFERRAVLRVVLPRFSVIALAAWGVLALTGLYSAWLQVGTAAALGETPYGQSLLLKGALLLPVLVLAAIHLKLGRTALDGRGRSRFARTIAAEALLAVGVLLVVGRLIGLEPAREAVANRTPPEIVIPLAFATNDGQRDARLAISPGAAGINTFTIEVDGEPMPTGAEGVLRFELAGRAMGAQELRLPAAGQNRFQAAGSDVTLPGNWRIEAIVRAIGTFSWATELVVPIGETPRPVSGENPGPRFAPIGIAGMVALAIGVAGLAAAAAFPDARLARRRNIANASAIPLVVGAMVLAGARIPSPDPPVQIAAQPLPMPIASPNVVAHDDHMMDHHAHATPTVSSATPEPLLGPGTTLSGDGISVTLAAAPQVSGPVTVSIKIGEAEGSPLAEARVAVISDMPDMAMGRMETPALETEPGLYVAEFVPLGMTGEWRLAVRVSPRGASTQVFAFAVQVP